MPSDEFIARIMNADRKLAAADQSTPTHNPRPAKQPTTVDEMRAESKRLAATNPALVKARAAKEAKRQHALTSAERNAAQVRAFAFANEAVKAYNEEEFVYDEATGDYVNRGFEQAVTAMLEIGEPATAAFQQMTQYVDTSEIEEVIAMVAERDALREQAELLREGEQYVQEIKDVGKRLQDRLVELINLNDQFNPQVHIEEAERIRAQMPHATAPSDREALSKKIEESMNAAIQAKQYQDDAVGRWLKMAEAAGGAFANYDLGEEALIQSLQITDNYRQAVVAAETKTKALRAHAEQSGVGADGRDASGKLVMIPADGSLETILTVEDGDAGALLAQGWRILNKDVEVPAEMPDHEASLFPQPTAEQVANDFASYINEKDQGADAEALQAAIEWGAQAPTVEGQAAVEEARAKADHEAMLRDANQLAAD